MEKLEKLFSEAFTVDISNRDRLVIFSDLHMGDGGRMDDFLHNGEFFKHILEHYYEKQEYKLILDGDVDELHRFSLKAVYRRWTDLYTIFKRFFDRGALLKIFGNHDLELSEIRKLPEDIPIFEAVKLRFNNNYIFIFHGHQVGRFFFKIGHRLINIILRFFANTLRIKNYSVAQNKRKKFNIEKKVYEFSRRKKIMTFIGHTHRPLFESLSKKETLKFRIENLCREYPTADDQRRQYLEQRILKYKEELRYIIHKREEEDLISTLYNSNSEPLVPCLFNAGCAIGKSGITALEIFEGNIRLVYWFDKNISQKYFDFNGYVLEPLNNSPYYKVILKEDSLDYMFARIRLLSD